MVQIVKEENIVERPVCDGVVNVLRGKNIIASKGMFRMYRRSPIRQFNVYTVTCQDTLGNDATITACVKINGDVERIVTSSDGCY